MTLVERLFTVMTKPWVAMSYLGLIALSYFYLDKPLILLISAYHLDTCCSYLQFLTLFGENKIYLISLLLCALFFHYIKHNQQWARRAWFLWLCVLISNLICLILKVSLGRARPELWFNEQLYGFYGFHHQSSYWSFPSGHTTTMMGFVFGLGLVFPRYAWLYLLFGCTVMLTRILLLQHYVSDVLIAVDLALLEVGVLWIFARRKKWLKT